jgi:hypothetical protein
LQSLDSRGQDTPTLAQLVSTPDLQEAILILLPTIIRYYGPRT